MYMYIELYVTLRGCHIYCFTLCNLFLTFYISIYRGNACEFVLYPLYGYDIVYVITFLMVNIQIFFLPYKHFFFYPISISASNILAFLGHINEQICRLNSQKWDCSAKRYYIYSLHFNKYFVQVFLKVVGELNFINHDFHCLNLLQNIL